MTIDQLERELMKLPTKERARLAESLIRSLDELSVEEAARAWNEEASRRDAELDENPDRGVPASEALERARRRG